MTTIALQVRHTILTECPHTFTLYGGYGQGPRGRHERVQFAGGTIRNERRNDKDRVVYTECHYSDGSYLVYRYSTQQGNYSLHAYKGKQS